jgi:hypothetical protein
MDQLNIMNYQFNAYQIEAAYSGIGTMTNSNTCHCYGKASGAGGVMCDGCTREYPFSGTGSLTKFEYAYGSAVAYGGSLDD